MEDVGETSVSSRESFRTLEAEILDDVAGDATATTTKPVVTLHPLLAKLQSSNNSAYSESKISVLWVTVLLNFPQ